jgi:hypothetical protein
MSTLPPSCADCLEIWDPQLSGTLRVCPRLLGIVVPLLISEGICRINALVPHNWYSLFHPFLFSVAECSFRKMSHTKDLLKERKEKKRDSLVERGSLEINGN